MEIEAHQRRVTARWQLVGLSFLSAGCLGGVLADIAGLGAVGWLGLVAALTALNAVEALSGRLAYIK